jgi:hypothetical protein
MNNFVKGTNYKITNYANGVTRITHIPTGAYVRLLKYDAYNKNGKLKKSISIEKGSTPLNVRGTGIGTTLRALATIYGNMLKVNSMIQTGVNREGRSKNRNGAKIPTSTWILRERLKWRKLYNFVSIFDPGVNNVKPSKNWVLSHTR